MIEAHVEKVYGIGEWSSLEQRKNKGDKRKIT